MLAGTAAERSADGVLLDPVRATHDNPLVLIRCREQSSVIVDQVTDTFRQRTEGFFSRNGTYQAEQVVLILRLFGSLHFDQVHVVHHAAVFADIAVASEDIVDRHGCHLATYSLSIVGADGLNGLQIMQGA